MKLSPKVTKMLYSLALVMAGVAVNSTCFCRFHQEKMDPQLDALKKYRD
ncbi:MAG: cyclic lactone autoinducer peptide [Lachnospiraceae bacterium]|nr:cyclic lactone autoinducer peptide [Lachnospiraceae bacterium]